MKKVCINAVKSAPDIRVNTVKCGKNYHSDIILSNNVITLINYAVLKNDKN